MATSKEVIPISHFFTYLTLIINLVGSFCKQNDQLKIAQATKVAKMITINDLETGKERNQIGTLKRASDTHWGSYLSSLRSLLLMFDETYFVLENVIENGNSSIQRSETDGAYDIMTSFEFVFILHLMKELLRFTDDLSQVLQRKSQDILNAMHLVSLTKRLFQKFRDDG